MTKAQLARPPRRRMCVIKSGIASWGAGQVLKCGERPISSIRGESKGFCLLDGTHQLIFATPISQKDHLKLLASIQLGKCCPDKPPLLASPDREPECCARGFQGFFGVTPNNPDRFLTRVRRRVALWLPKGVGTFGRRAPLAWAPLAWQHLWQAVWLSNASKSYTYRSTIRIKRKAFHVKT